MAYELCKICEEKVANPLHVNVAHAMDFTEYKKLTQDPEFLKDLEKNKKLREEQEAEEERKRMILTERWFPRASSLTGIMKRYREHAKPNTTAFQKPAVDISNYEELDEATVPTIELAEALIQSGGWECITKKGGHDGSPKQYIMKRNKQFPLD